ncbi:MAG: restriction endonuclease [Gammaproteobacteria bacterium]
MPEITRKRSGELIRGVFQILGRESDAVPAKDVLRRLEELVPPTPYEASSYPNRPNVRRYEKIVRFNTIAPVKAGWLIKNKGSWALTDLGRAAFEKFKDPERFSLEARRLYNQWKADQPDDENEEAEHDSGQAAATLEEAEEAAWSEIQAFLERMNPYDFQELVAGLLSGMGYFVEWVSPPGPDKGIDIVAHVDPLGVKGPRIKAQVKRRADKIAADGVRGFMALLGDADVGIFVSTGGFTRDAEEEARRQEKRRIMLLDLKRLFDLWTQHYDRIPESKRQLLPLRPVYYLAPDE